MEKIKSTIKNKINLCLTSINNCSGKETDKVVAETVEHLARAYSYLSDIEKKED